PRIQERLEYLAQTIAELREQLGLEPLMPEDLAPEALEDQAEALDRTNTELERMDNALAAIERFHGHPGMAEILRAIYRAEGGEAARVPFGMTAFSDAGNQFMLERNREVFRQLIEATGFEEGSREYYAAAASVTV